MNRTILSTLFIALLVASISIKMLSHGAAALSSMYPGDDDIASLLQKNGFETRKADANTDPAWTYGVRKDCRLQIANVSPQGWHRSIIEWEAVGQTLVYSADGRLYGSQPIIKPMTIHYLHRLERYMGIDAPPVRVRAIIIAPECPSNAIASTELASLS
jgi:hypothetical protein